MDADYHELAEAGARYAAARYAASQSWGTYQWGSYTDGIEVPEERPDPLAEPAGYGASRAGRTQGASTPQDGRCDVHNDHVRCLAGRNWVVWFGCVHEHVGPVDVCDGHIADVADKRYTCTFCKDTEISRPVRFERLNPPGRWDMELPPEARPAPDLTQFFAGPPAGRERSA